MDISQFRQQYPQYNDMSDQQLADAIHEKFYSDMPKEKVYEALRFSPQGESDLSQRAHAAAGGLAAYGGAIPEALIGGMSAIGAGAQSLLPEGSPLKGASPAGETMTEAMSRGMEQGAGGAHELLRSGVNAVSPETAKWMDVGGELMGKGSELAKQYGGQAGEMLGQALPGQEGQPQPGMQTAGEVAGDLLYWTALFGGPKKAGEAVRGKPVAPKSEGLNWARDQFPELKNASDAEVMTFLERQKGQEDVNAQTPAVKQEEQFAGPPQQQVDQMTQKETRAKMKQALDEVQTMALETPKEEVARLQTSKEGINYERPIDTGKPFRQALDTGVAMEGARRSDARSRLAIENFRQAVEDAELAAPLQPKELAEIQSTLTGVLKEGFNQNTAVADAMLDALQERKQRAAQVAEDQWSKMTPEEQKASRDVLAEAGSPSAINDILGRSNEMNPRDALRSDDARMKQALSMMENGKSLPGESVWQIATSLQSPAMGARIARIAGNLFKGFTKDLPTVSVRYNRAGDMGKHEVFSTEGRKIAADAFYDPIAHEVILNPDRAPNWSAAHFAGVVTHELMHGMINNAQLRYGNMTHFNIKMLPEEKQAIALSVKRIEQLHNIANQVWRKKFPGGLEQNSNLEWHYGLTNPREFAAEIISNPSFQRFLDGIQFDSSKYGWEQPKGALRTMLDAAVSQIRTILNKALGNKANAGDLSLYKQSMKELADLVVRSEKERTPLDPAEAVAAMQRGAISRTSQDVAQVIRGEKEEFINNLPDEYKYLGDRLWAEKQRQESKLSSGGNTKAATGGYKAVLDKFQPLTQEYDAIKDTLRKEHDIPSGVREKVGQQIVAGAKLYSRIKDNKIVQYAADQVTAMMRAKDAAAYKLLDDPHTGVTTAWTALRKVDQVKMWNIINDPKNWKKRWLSAEDLKREYNASPAMVKAYETWKLAAETTLGELNKVWEREGLPTVEAKPGYFPARWDGAFYSEIYTKDGKLARIESDNSRNALNKRINLFKEQHGDKYDISPIKSRPRVSDKEAVGKGIRDLFSILAETLGKNSFEAAELEEIFKMYGELTAEKRKDFLRHTMQARTERVEGYLGSGFGKSDFVNMKDGVRAMQTYLKDSHDYIETRKTSREINKLLYDRELDAPNAKAYIQDYWNNALGIEQGAARFINSMAEWLPRELGMNPKLLQMGLRGMKTQALLLFLGYFRPIFLATQLMQPWQFMMPQFLEVARIYGKDAPELGLGAMVRGYGEALNSMVSKGQNLTGITKELYNYAMDRRLVDPHFLEELSSADSVNQVRKVLRYAQGRKALEWAEQQARLMSLYAAGHVLENMGIPRAKIPGIAADLVDVGMTNYMRHERAMIYNKLGIAGEMISPLTTFKHNYFSQLYMFTKVALAEGIKDPAAWRPVFYLLGMQALLAGAMGMPGFQELEWLFGVASKAGLMPKDFNLTRSLFNWSAQQPKSVRDSVRYGVVSGQTGWDISPSFASAQLLPLDGFASFLTVPGKALDIASAAADVAGGELGRLAGGQGSTVDERANLMRQVTPAGLQGAAEYATSTPTPSGGLMVGSPGSRGAGMYERKGAEPWIARAFGVRTTEESNQRHIMSAEKQVRAQLAKAKAKIITEAIARAAAGQDLTQLYTDYAEMGGTPTEFIQAVRDGVINRYKSATQRLTKPGTPTGNESMNRMNEMGAY